MRRYRAVGLAMALALVPSFAQAQSQFAVSVFGGGFLPASDLSGGIIFIAPGEVVGFPGGDVAATFRQKTAFDFGGRLTLWVTQRFGFEAEVAYALSDLNVDLLVPIADPGPPITVNLLRGEAPVDGNVFLGSLNVVFALIRPPLEPLVVYVSGGLGYVGRAGDAKDFLESTADNTSDIAGTWGFGLKYGVARGLWLRADVRDYIYKFPEAGELESKWQNDLMVNAGLEYAFGF